MERFNWTAEHIALLGTMPDPALAAQLGTKDYTVKHMRRKLGIPTLSASRWDADTLSLLGTMTDRALATRLGITEDAVRQKRKQQGIPAFGYRQTWRDIYPVQQQGESSDYAHMLGKVPDGVLASLLGITRQAVGYRRVKAGIPAFKKG